MAGKRYYWLKLQVSFFQELIIKQLRTLPEGDSIVLLYLKLLLKAINTFTIRIFCRLYMKK